MIVGQPNTIGALPVAVTPRRRLWSRLLTRSGNAHSEIPSALKMLPGLEGNIFQALGTQSVTVPATTAAEVTTPCRE